jgi:predicted ATPase
MTESSLKQPDLIGRDEELDKLKKSLENAATGKGSVTFIAGEAGIGKTRLVSELIAEAEKKGAQIIRGWCLAESLEPLMPVKSALREAGLFHLISGDPPPLVVSAYLMNDAGLLIAKAEREELGLDPYIFGSMLKAVGSFVKDSMQKIDNVDRTGGLNSLGYKEYKIIIEEHDGLFLAAVTKGTLSEMLVGDMKNVLTGINANFKPVLTGWDGDTEKLAGIDAPISRLVMSGKYSGKHIVDDPELRRESLFDNVLMGIRRLSAEKPILLFLDDLQWADPTTLTLLHYLAKNLGSHKVMMLGTYRPEDIMQSWDGKTHHLETTMQNMNREGLLEKIEIKRLDSDGSKAIVRSVLGASSFEGAVTDRIFHETEGNPFFVLEVLKLLTEEGTIAQAADGSWKLATDAEKLDIPSKVYDVVKRRLDRLMEEQRRILDCASVVGDEFRSDVLGKVVDVDKRHLLENLSKIEKTHKLVHYLKDKYRFDHAKIRDVLYNGIGEELRREYHRVVGDTIAELHKDNTDSVAGELAHHYYEAGDERAAKYLLTAGEKAFKDYCMEEANRIFSRVLEVAKTPDESMRGHIGIIEIFRFLGDADTVMDHINRAKKYLNENIDDEIKIKFMLAEATTKRHFDEELSEDTEKLFTTVIDKCKKHGNQKELARAYSYLAASHFASSNYKKSLELMKIKLNIDEQLGNKENIVHTLNRIGWILFRMGDYQGGIDNLCKSLTVCEEINYTRGVLSYCDMMAWAAEEIKGDYEKAIKFQEKMIDNYLKLGGELDISSIPYSKGKIAILKGQYSEATEIFKNYIVSASKLNDHYGIAGGYYYIGTIYVRTGKFDDAISYFERTLEERKNIIKNQIQIGHALNYIGRIQLMKGNAERALEYFNQSLELFQKIGGKAGISYTLTKITEASILTNNIQEAEASAKKALSIASEIGARVEEGMSHRALGMVHFKMGNWGMALSEIEIAMRILEDADRQEYATTLYEFGLFWQAKDETTKAKEYLEKALAEFERMHMKFWADKCRKALGGLEQ